MAIIKTHNAQGGSDARYDITRMTSEERARFDNDGRPLGADNPGQWEWTQGLPGAREMNSEGGGGGSGGGSMSGGFQPNLGTYGYDVARAKLAYERAVASSDEGIQKLNRNTGFLRNGDKTQIDPNNRFGALQLMLGQHGGQLNEAWAAAAARGIGHKGLGAQGETDLRYTQSGQVADLGNRYQDSYKDFLQSKADAKAEYDLAKQMGMYNTLSTGGYSYGGGGGDYGDYGQQQQESPYGVTLAPTRDFGFGQIDTYLSQQAKQLAASAAKNPSRVNPYGSLGPSPQTVSKVTPYTVNYGKKKPLLGTY